MIEIKLAPKEQTNTFYTSKDRVSLYICRLHSSAVSQPLHLCHFLFAFDLPALSLLTHSPHPVLHNNEIKNDLHSCLTLALTFPPFFPLILSILSPSVFPFSLSSACLRNVSEQHKRTKALKEEEEEKGERGLESCVR